MSSQHFLLNTEFDHNNLDKSSFQVPRIVKNILYIKYCMLNMKVIQVNKIMKMMFDSINDAV